MGRARQLADGGINDAILMDAGEITIAEFDPDNP